MKSLAVFLGAFLFFSSHSCLVPCVHAAVIQNSPGHEFVETMLSFYRDENKLIRFQALSYSVGLAPRDELIEVLRELAAHPEDEIERAATYYVLASMTMQQKDIEAFLDSFLYSARTVFYMYCLESRLTYGDGTRLYRFLVRLARFPVYREKAQSAIVALSLYLDDLSCTSEYASEFNNWTPIPKNIIEYGERYAGAFEVCGLFADIDTFDKTAIDLKLFALIDSTDLESRVIIYLMHRIFFSRICRGHAIDMHYSLFEKFFNTDVEINEKRVLCFSLLEYSGWRYSHAPWTNDLVERYASLLPLEKSGVVNLLSLEERTYKNHEGSSHLYFTDNVASSIVLGRKGNTDILDVRFQKKLSALLDYGQPYIDNADYRRLLTIGKENGYGGTAR